jgi:hypothetical protein
MIHLEKTPQDKGFVFLGTFFELKHPGDLERGMPAHRGRVGQLRTGNKPEKCALNSATLAGAVYEDHAGWPALAVLGIASLLMPIPRAQTPES